MQVRKRTDLRGTGKKKKGGRGLNDDTGTKVVRRFASKTKGG